MPRLPAWPEYAYACVTSKPVFLNHAEQGTTPEAYLPDYFAAAEEVGVTRENAAHLRDTHANPTLRRALGAGGGYGPALGVGEDWALNAIRSVGNYGEMFQRNIARVLGVERGLNRLWTEGGLMYAPPFR